jgi:hypothetical protein
MAPFINQEQVIIYDDEWISTSLESSPLPSSSSLTPSARRSVSFAADLTTTHYVLHIHDFSLAEQRACWYNEGDMLAIRKSWKDSVTYMESNVSFDEEISGLCVRGLEGKTKEGKRIRKAARNSSITAVMDEQIYQDMDGIVDPVMIAIAYSDCCFDNQKDAFFRGYEDYKVARILHELPQAPDDIVEPTKFDFESVRRNFEVISRDGDGLVAASKNGPNVLGLAKNNKNNLFHGDKFMDRFACFLPITPKRYARRVKNTIR